MRRAIRVWALVAAAGVAVSCAAFRDDVVYETGRPAEVTPDGLHRVKSSFARVYLKPGTDLRPYDKILLSPVELRFKSVQGGADIGGRGIETKQLRKRFRAIFEEELAKSKLYTLTDQPGPAVLEVSAELIDLAVLGPDPADANIVLIRTPSSMTLMLEIADSESNEVLARASDRVDIKAHHASLQRTRSTIGNPNEARFLFRSWASRLRKWLDSVREIPPLPEQPAADS